MVLQASVSYGVSFGPFSFQQYGLAAPGADIKRRQVADALMAPEMVVVGDEVAKLLLEITAEVVVLEKITVLERLVRALDLDLRLAVDQPTDP